MKYVLFYSGTLNTPIFGLNNLTYFFIFVLFFYQCKNLLKGYKQKTYVVVGKSVKYKHSNVICLPSERNWKNINLLRSQKKTHNNFFFRFYILCWHRTFRVNLYSDHCLNFIPAGCFWGFTLTSNLNCYFFWIIFLKRTSKWTAVNTQVVSKSQNDYLDIH